MAEISDANDEPYFGRIGFSEAQGDLMDVAANFCREKSPIEKVRSLMETDKGFDADTWREIADLGWLAIALPEEYGGVGLSLAEVVPVMEQMGRAMMATPFLSSTLAAQAILAGGTEEQKKTLLPKIAAGEIATLACMEKDGAWGLTKIAARAERHGDQFTLYGGKHLVGDADAAAHIIVSVLYEGEPALLTLDRSAIADARLRREGVIDETKRSYALTLDGLKAPASSLMNREKARAALSHIHLVGVLLSAAECCGGAKAVIDYTVDYLKTRKQFGKLIGSYQALKHPTVDAFVRYEQARSHLYSAAHCFNDQGTGEIATRMARAEADATLSYASDRSIQFHGGFGFTYDCDAQLYRRRAAFHAALYGDGAYHKKQLAALLF